MWWQKAGVIGVVFSVVLVPQGAFAHATPTTYTPAAGATELTVPETVTIHFSERIEEAASSIRVFAPDGAEAHTAEAAPADDPRVFIVPIEGDAEGVYTVSWQVVSVDDGHFTKGSYSFLVDATGKAFEGSAESVQVAYVTSLREALIGFVSLLGESVLVGALMVYYTVVRPLARRGSLPTALASRVELFVSRSVILGALLVAMGTISTILLKAQDLGGLRDEGLLEAIMTYLQSSVGTAAGIKVIASALIIVAFLIGRKYFFAKRWSVVAVVVAALLLLILYLQSKVSHATASFFYPNVSVLLTGVHLFFKEILVGGVLMVTGLYVLAARTGDRQVGERAHALYNRLAVVAIVGAGTSGAYISWLHLKRLENLFLTEWGERFFLLLILGVTVGALRFLNQFVVPLPPRARIRYVMLRIFTLALEALVALVMLFYSGYIAITTPPFAVEQYAYEVSAVDDDIRLTLGTHPYEEGMLRIEAVDERSGEPVALKNVVVTSENSARGITTNVIEPLRRSENSFVIDETRLSPPGEWELAITAERDGAYNANAAFTLNYPDDIAATRYSDDVRVFDDFVKTMLGIAGAVLVLGVVFLGHAVWQVRREFARQKEEDEGEPLVRPRHTVLIGLMATIVAACLTLLILWAHTAYLRNDLYARCVADGHRWQQASPARQFEVLSPNSYVGCFIHDGHYHIIEVDEYEEALKDFAEY